MLVSSNSTSNSTDPSPVTLEAIWVFTLIGLLLSNIACGLVLYIYFQNRNLNSISLKIIAYANFYGMIYSLSWTVNLTVGLFLIGDAKDGNVDSLDTMCFVINPLKVFCHLQWFSWNGLILFILHQGIKNIKFDSYKLGIFIDRVFHPFIIIICLTVALLPFIKSEQFSAEDTSQYDQYICQFQDKNNELISKILQFITFLLPMWLIVFYTIFIYVDIYRTFSKLGLKSPNNLCKMMYQPIIISITWIWPTIGFLMKWFGIAGGNQFFLRAIFIITQGFTICLQSLIYLNQIQKTQTLVLCLDDRNENKLLLKNVVSHNKVSIAPLLRDTNYAQYQQEFKSTTQDPIIKS